MTADGKDLCKLETFFSDCTFINLNVWTIKYKRSFIIYFEYRQTLIATKIKYFAVDIII